MAELEAIRLIMQSIDPESGLTSLAFMLGVLVGVRLKSRAP